MRRSRALSHLTLTCCTFSRRREAFTGVVTLDKLHKEHRKAAAHPASVAELWAALVQHLQKVVESHSAALAGLSRCELPPRLATYLI